MIIESDDLVIRNIESSDAEEYFEIFSHPEVARFDDFNPITREDLPGEMKRIESYRPDSSFIELAVAVKDSNKMMGVLTLERKRRYYYLGYHFNPAYHGKGFATRAVMALIASMSDKERHSLRLVSDPDNSASIALARRVGFIFLKRRSKKGIAEVVYLLDTSIWEVKLREFSMFEVHS